MEDYKTPQEEPEFKEEPEEYSFLQEVIKDEAGSGKSLKNKILRLVGFGFVFGIVACITFCAFKPLIETRVGIKPDKVTIPKDEEPQEEAPVQTVDEETEEEQYGRMLRNLESVAASTRKSMVEIRLAAEEKVQDKGLHCVSGAVVADNGQELLLLGQSVDRENEDELQAVFFDDSVVSVTEKRKDKNLGLSVYAINRAAVPETLLGQVKALELGASYTVSVGDVVILAGKPLGQEDAVTYGSVTSCGDTVERADGRYEVLSVNASGYPGGSGVMVDTEGKVTGIISQKATENDNQTLIHGYGISDIKSVTEFLSNGNGVPYIGIRGTDVTDEMAEKQGIPKGVYVKEVEADSPAMAAGIQGGDVLTAADGSEVYSYDIYHNILMNQKEGNELTLKGFRQGAGGEYVEIDFSVTVGTKK